MTEVRRRFEIVNRLGARFWARGEYDHAIQVFEVMLEKWPHSATTWANLSVSRDGTGSEADAAGALQRALEIDPLNGFATRTRDSRR